MSIQKILSWTAVILWMVLIFNLSSQVADQSNQLSTGITKIVVNFIEKVAPNWNVDISSFNHIVRKSAHFFAYLVLGILAINALRRSEVFEIRSVIFALLICVLYAVTDEVHQLFVPGRGAMVMDVLIDSSGASIGIGVYLLIGKMFRRRKIM